jgi:hypothetical protein
MVSCITDVPEATSCATSNVLRDTFELVVTLFTATKNSSFVLELLHGHGRQSSALVVSSLVVVNFVDGNSGMDNIGLDNLLVNNRLDGLVDMLVPG